MDFFFGFRPWRKGRRRFRPPGFEPEYYVLDPDFDDDADDLAMITHSIDTYGSVALHHEARRNELVGVPLCSHVPDGGGGSEFPSLVLMRREIQENQRLRQKAKEFEATQRMAEWEEQCRVAGLPDVPPAPERPERPGVAMVREHVIHRQVNRVTPSVEMLEAMKLYIPIARGAGRVWRNMVMMNEADESHRAAHWVEVWRGSGYVLFNAEGSL
jgi:hypothetical protein